MDTQVKDTKVAAVQLMILEAFIAVPPATIGLLSSPAIRRQEPIV